MEPNLTALLPLITERNDQKAFRVLYNHYFERLYEFALSFLKKRDEAQMVVADVFIKVWEQREKLKEVKDLTAWLYICTRNRTYDHLRQNLQQVTGPLDENAVLDFHIDNRTPETELQIEELFSSLEAALLALPPRQKVAFQLIRMEHMSYKEAAAVLDVSVSAVEKLVVKATAHLLELLHQHVEKQSDTRRGGFGHTSALSVSLLFLLFLKFFSQWG